MNYEEWLQDIVDSIDDTLNQDCDIDIIIKNSFYSKTHFYRIFGSIVGVSPSEYIKKRKISCAAVEICMTEKRLLDIAVEYGFASQEVFTRAFQREYGVTPGRLRKAPYKINLYEKVQIKKKLEDRRKLLNGYSVQLVVCHGCSLTGYEDIVRPGSDQIKILWNRLISNIEMFDRRNNDLIYGICEYAPDITDEDDFSYFFGIDGNVKVENDVMTLDERVCNKEFAASKYARIVHDSSKRTLKETYNLFYGAWLPLSGLKLEQKDTIELYHLEDDRLEIFIPIE